MTKNDKKQASSEAMNDMNNKYTKASTARKSRRNEEKPVVDKRNRQLSRSSKMSVWLLLFALILLNVLFTRFLGPATTFDWTANKSMTLGDVSRELIADLESPARIVVLMNEGDFPGRQYAQVDFVEGLLKEYDDLGGDDLTLEFIDPEINPGIIKELDPQGQNEARLVRGNIAVFGSETGKIKILSPRDFVDTQMNQQYQPMITGYSAESALSGAINYVSSLDTPVVYLSQGHGEAKLDDGFNLLKQLLEYNNFEIKELDSLTLKEIPDDGRFVFLLDPQQDLADSEVAVYKDYIKRGGNILIVSEFSATEFTNLNTILREFDLELTQNRVMENEASKQIDQASYSFLAATNNTRLGNFGKEAWTIVSQPRQVKEAGNAKEWIETEVLLTTDDQGTIEVGGDTEEVSELGKQSLAMISENKGWIDGKDVTTTSKAIVFGTTAAFHDSILQSFLRQSANYLMLGSSLNYLGEVSGDRLFIRSKPVVSYALGTQYQGSLNTASVISWLVIPLIFVAIAISVYRRRKHL